MNIIFSRSYLPEIDLKINQVGARRRVWLMCADVPLWRPAFGLYALGMAVLLSACGGGHTNGVPTYTIGGTVSGLADGQSLELSNGSETITRNANGAFTFVTQVTEGGSYEVKVSGAQPAWQICSTSNAAGSAVNANVSSVVVNCISSDLAATGQLNDTGIDWCTENISTPFTWVNNAVCSAINWAGNLWGQQQDAFFGRDARVNAGTLQKVGGGMVGFDFTRIGSSGKPLANQNGVWSDGGSEATGNQWDCVRDNTTGLVWEVKHNDANHLRYMGHRYGWYNPNAANNGGSAGYETPQYDAHLIALTGPTCSGVANVNKCNTQSYIAAVNAVALCGKKDWRMPTVDELHNLANTGRTNPAIDTDFFPNTASDWYWSSSPNAGNSDHAWYNHFHFGYGYFASKSIANRVRLVRSGQ